METVLALHDANDRTTRTLYSLEKLIEWKLNLVEVFLDTLDTLYSLEKLIEWKLGYLSVSLE